MSEPTAENENRDSRSDEGRITDDQLPDDLNPQENPLAAEPDDSEGDGSGAPPDAPGGAGGAGGAGLGQPG